MTRAEPDLNLAVIVVTNTIKARAAMAAFWTAQERQPVAQARGDVRRQLDFVYCRRDHADTSRYSRVSCSKAATSSTGSSSASTSSRSSARLFTGTLPTLRQ